MSTAVVGSVAPVAIRAQVGPVVGLDLTTVVSVRIELQRPGSVTPTLHNATINGTPTATALVADYVLAADGSDLPVLGHYGVCAWLSLPSGGPVYVPCDGFYVGTHFKG